MKMPIELPRITIAIFAVILSISASTAEAQYSRYGGRGYGGYGGRSFGGYGGRSSFGYGSRSFGGYGGRSSFGYGSAYRSSFGKSYRGGFNSYRSGFGYSPSYRSYRSPSYSRYYNGGYYNSGYNGGGYYGNFRSNQLAPVSRIGTNFNSPVVVSSTPVGIATTPSPYVAARPGIAEDNRGWSQLASGDIAGARQSFAQLATTSTSASPKIGFSLAAIADGDTETGAWAMRRALAIDPQLVSNKLSDVKLQPMLSNMVNRLHADLSTSPNNSNTTFLLAQLDRSGYSETSMGENSKAEVSVAKPMMEPNESMGNKTLGDNTLPPNPTIVLDTELPPEPTLSL